MTLSFHDVAQELGLREDYNGTERTDYYCPVHDNKTGDLSVYNASHSDGPGFACHGEGGSKPISLVMHCKGYSSIEQGIEWLQEHFPEECSDYSEEDISRRQKAQDVLNKATELAHDTLTKRKTALQQQICDNRAFTRDDIEEYWIGYLSYDDADALKSRFDKQALIDSGIFKEGDNGVFTNLTGRITFPHRRSQQTYFMAGRLAKDDPDRAKYKKVWKTEYNKHILYGFGGETTGEGIIITEGYTDAISAHKAGYDVITPATNKFKDSDREKLLRQAQSYEKVYIAMDGDEGGEEGTEKTADELTRAGVEPLVIDLDNGLDLDDYTSEYGYNITALIEDAEEYIDTLITGMSDARRSQRREIKKKIFSLIADWERLDQNEVLDDLPGSKRENRTALNDYIKNTESEQSKDANQNSSQVDTESISESEGSVSTGLDLHSHDIRINPNNSIHVNHLVNIYQETKSNEHGVIDNTPVFKVFEFQFSEGEGENKYKLLPIRTTC